MSDIELTLEKDGFCGVYHEGTSYPGIVILRVAGSGAPRANVLSCSSFLFEAVTASCALAIICGRASVTLLTEFRLIMWKRQWTGFEIILGKQVYFIMLEETNFRY